MENNNYNTQQQYYQQPVQQQQYVYQQPNDPTYMATVGEFLKNAIISCCIASLPVGSIIAICMATKYRKQLLEYLEKGGLHTPRVKTSSALLRAGRYAGIAYTIFWAVYALYFAIWIMAGIYAMSTGLSH